jgi:uncharacterized protein (TIGR03435 family)
VRTLIGIALLAAGELYGQSAGTAPAFDVASVKADSQSPYADFRVLPGGRLEVIGLELKTVLLEAYHVKYYQISGGPTWLNTDRFNITAKAEGNPTRERMMEMLQTLLADRFKLKVHRESKEGSVYVLTVMKDGPKLKPPTGEKSYIALYRNTPPELPGVSYALGGKKASMALFAERLGEQLRRPVLDKTGLIGEFDFKVDYAINDNPETGPSIFMALQEQLGLKLETAKGPIETLFIDHVEKPTGN